MLLKKNITALKGILYLTFLGITTGIAIHFILVFSAYNKLVSKIENARATSTIFKNDPSIGKIYSLNEKIAKSRSAFLLNSNPKLVWRILVNMGVVDWNSSLDDVSPKLLNAVVKVLNESPIDKLSTIDFAIKVADALGSDVDSEEVNAVVHKLIVNCLAKGPRANENYEAYVNSLYDPPVQKQMPSTNFLAFLGPRSLLSNLWGKKTEQQEIGNLLFIHTYAAAKYDNLPSENSGSISAAQEYTQINSFFQHLLISIHDDPEVISSSNWLLIIEGPEQFFMYLFFFTGFYILVLNFVVAKNPTYEVSPKLKSFTVVVYKWIAIALPSLGFIGTKRGLSEALSRADTIVRAGSEINQALAISNVSQTMGIAFTSTLVGLILLMILMFLELFIKYQNMRWDEQE